jgi:serine/threonine-protein kinase
LSTYTIERELGRGGMAVVYAGRHETLDRPVALKVLAAHLAGDPTFAARFLREARIAARLAHPNLVRTYDITEHDGLPCIVMELVPGGTLEGGRLTRDEAAQIAAGLAYAHAKGVVHRDLKPANILRSAAGEPKLADFGIARALDETRLTETGAIVGTLRYLSPEQASGHPAGPESDVYALGVVLDELLTNREPADDALLDRCRAAEPAARPTAGQVATELRGETAVAPTRVLHRRPRRPGRRAWVAAAAVATVLALTGVGVAVSSAGHATIRVEQVPHAASTSQQARNLAAWLSRYSK